MADLPHKPREDQIAPGRDKSIDATDPKDQALIREAVKRWPKRWRGLTDSFKDSIVDDLVHAGEIARNMVEVDPAAAVDRIVSIARTAIAMEGQVQADEHLDNKNQREDEGKGLQQVAVVQVQWTTPAQLAARPDADD